MAEDGGTPPGKGTTASGSDDSTLEAPLKSKPCRIHLVGVLATSDGASEVHLGPWTAPASADQDPSLLDFATAIKKLIRIAAGQDTWWRFEYMCYGNPVPILSDEALCEAFNYFRDQNQTLSPAEAAAACRLYLWPTSKQPPWTLTDYLAEPRLGLNNPLNTVSSLNPGSQVSGDRCPQGAGYRPTPLQLNPHNLAQYNPNHHSNNHSCSEGGSEPASSAGEGPAADDGQAAAALGGTGDGGASSSSSHEAPQQQQQQRTDTGLHSPENASWAHPPAATPAAAFVTGLRLPPILLNPADQASNSRKNRQQQQQLQRVIKRGASGNVDPTAENTWALAAASAQQHQQQHQQQSSISAAAGELSILSQQQQHVDGNGRRLDARSSKAAKRESASSPRSQWLQEQQQQQQLQQQQFFQQQQEHQAGARTAPLLSAFATVPQPTASLGAADPAAAGAMAAAFLQQQQQQVAGSGLPPHMRQSVNIAPANDGGRADSDGDAVGSGLAGSFASLDQLQQLHLSSSNLGSLAGGSSNLPARANSITSAANLGIFGQQQQQGMPASLNHHQQQQVSNALSAGQINPRFQPRQLPDVLNIGQVPSGQFLFSQGTAADLLPGVQLGGSSSLVATGSTDLAAAGSGRAVEAAAAGGGRGSSTGAVDGNLAGLQLSVAASRVKSETKTKYADGRFKDEARHQQRLSDMKARCDALFGGAIQNNFQIEHHKRVTCLVCNSTVVPYEAYHIDAVRKHFVRHHETWLAEAGVDVDLWRKSCAPIARGAVGAAARGAASAAAGSGKPNGAAVADDAAAEDDGAGGRKGSSTRLADGRYKDPQQHEQRLLDMQARCAALFNGTMTQHWTINNHKSISCHLCQQNITPYAAYHPDCLRKHFVRRHEELLIAAGVDVAAWSKGIPVGRRKLKALLQQQQQQQQQQQPHLVLQGSGQMPLVLQEHGQQQQQQQGLLLPVQNQPQLWSWLNAQQMQMQQQHQQPDGLEAGPAVPSAAVAGNGHYFVGLQQHLQQQQSGAPLISSGSYGPAQSQQQQQLASGLSSALQQQQQVPVLHDPVVNTSTSRTALNPQGFGSPDIASEQQQQQYPTHPQQPRQPQQVAAVGFAGPSVQQQLSPNGTIQFAAHGSAPQPAPVAATPGSTQQPLLAVSSMPAPALSRLASTDALPLDGLGLKRDAGDLNPTSLSDPDSQQGLGDAPKRMLGLLQQQQKQLQLQQQQGAVAEGKGPNADPNFSGGSLQQQRTTADWARSMSDVQGFGPMSLSPAMGLAGLANSLTGGSHTLPGSLMDMNMGGVGSLTEADVAAMWDDDDVDVGHLDDSALADELLKQASQWAVQQSSERL